MKKNLLFIILLFTIINYSQVGIGTTDPKATLQVVGSPTVTTSMDGIIPPRLTGDQLNAKTYTADQKGALVYVTAARTNANAGQTPGVTAEGYYFFDGTVWNKVGSDASSVGVDVGYILGWTSNVTPPDYLLPLNGGTYNKADFPDLITQHGTHPNQFIASETGTTFTLKNINDQRVLRGNTTAGTNGGANTKTIAQNQLPNVTLTTTTNLLFTTYGSNVNGPSFYGSTPTDAGSRNYAGTTSSINGGVTQESFDVQSAYTDVIWCIKAKPTSTTGTITINNTTATATNGLTATSGQVKLGGALVEPTTISGVTDVNKLNVTATGVDAINFDSNTLSIDATNNRVGIGTAAPSQPLHIEGNARLTGNIYDGNNAPGANGQVLSSDGTKTTWVNNVSITPTVIGTPEATLTNVNIASNIYLQRSIVIPTGKYIVNIGVLMQGTNLASGNGYWIRLVLSSSSSSNTLNSGISYLGSSLVGVRVDSGSVGFQFSSGSIIINNDSGSSQTMYLRTANVDIVGSPNAQFFTAGGENYLYAQPIN